MKKSYWVVQVEFMDHAKCTGGSEVSPVPCLVWGLLYDETKTHYKLCSWASDKNPESEQSDRYAILKKSNVKIRRLSRVQLWE